jgi:hypothetical protein
MNHTSIFIVYIFITYIYIFIANILLLHWGNVVVILIIAFSLWKKLFKNNDHDVAFYSGLKLLFSDCIS